MELPDEIWRRISLMSLQLQYPYTSQAPRRRNLQGFVTPPELEDRRSRQSGFYGDDGSWVDYIGLKKRNRKKVLAIVGRQGEAPHVPITTGWLMIALRHWIRRAVNAIKRRRLFDTQIGNPEPAYGIKYPD